jgi:hypothetical protein
VVRALVVVCVLARVAAADEDDRDARTHKNLLGFQIGGGKLPIHDTELRATSMGLAVERRLVGTLRIAGGYEYMVLGVDDPDSDEEKMVTTGNGHRAEISLRHAFASTKVFLDNLRLFVDVEIGVAMLVGSTTQTGTLVDAQAFAGIRLGYDILKLRESSRASVVCEPIVFVHAVATDRDQVGVLAGIGLNWGD